MLKKLVLATLVAAGLSATATPAQAYYPYHGGYAAPYYGYRSWNGPGYRAAWSGYGPYYNYSYRVYPTPYYYPYPAYAAPRVGFSYVSPNVGVYIGY